MSEQFGYGTRFYKTVSDDLKSILPDVKSFLEFHGDITK